ncbi:MAG: class I SAM-dependent methyltransferase [Lysobacterales bacterium]|nr:MAG: class I SAM-dependent methyltransferase [Xanthomonadales bacterium]
MYRKLQELLRRLPLRSGTGSGPTAAAAPGAGQAEADAEYARRLLKEQGHFDDCLNVHELPDIFHYWSNRYLRPMFEPFGFSSPNDFFLQYIRRACAQNGARDTSIVSIGAGNCDLEIDLGEQLLAAGLGNFRIDCVEINGNMLDRARARVADSMLAPKLRFLRQDFNRWRPGRGAYDVIMANQSLHHVLELEHLFDAIRDGLAEEGLFLTSDMIGRNGHQRWPEALAMLKDFWAELPEAYRYNRLLQRQEPTYINHDCSTEGFEGIRAQDVLPLLLERFHFELFVPYGNLVFVFIDRPFGHNFDATGEWDRDFVDRVHAADESALLDGRIKPTSMLAALRLKPVETRLRDPRLTPQFSVRPPH